MSLSKRIATILTLATIITASSISVVKAGPPPKGANTGSDCQVTIYGVGNSSGVVCDYVTITVCTNGGSSVSGRWSTICPGAPCGATTNPLECP